MINFISVFKRYPDGREALKDINLAIQPGTLTFLVGPTGSGKSSLIKLLYREEEPSSGEILVFDRDISRLGTKDIPRLRQQTGVIFQDFKLLPQRTVAENVAFPLEIMGISRKDQAKRIHRALELTQLGHLAEVFPQQLSGGEQQRVSVARAIINKPPLLLADEPTGNLDPKTSWEIMKLLAKIAHNGTTVIVATHDHMVVNKLKRRVIHLEAGEIKSDTPSGGYHHGQ